MNALSSLVLVVILAAVSFVGGQIGGLRLLFGVIVPYAAIATFGIVLAAWYLLGAVRRTLFGALNPANAGLTDMSAREIAVMLPLVVFFFVIGLFPNLFFEKINPAVGVLVSQHAQTTVVAGTGSE